MVRTREVLADVGRPTSAVYCEDRNGTGPPRARTQVIYVDIQIEPF